MSLALFFFNLFHVNFLLFGDILQASLHKFSEGLEFVSRFKEGGLIVVLHDSHAVEEFLKVELQVFEASFFAGSRKDMKREVLKHLVEECLVSRRLFGDKDVLEGLQGVLAENSSMVECHVLLQKWQDLWDKWLEALTHGTNDSENMVECGSLGEDVAGVEKIGRAHV